MFQKYGERPSSSRDYANKIGSKPVEAAASEHPAGVDAAHQHYQAKNRDQAMQAFKPDFKKRELGGTKNDNEKWWYNEGANCTVSQQGKKDKNQVAGKIGQRIS